MLQHISGLELPSMQNKQPEGANNYVAIAEQPAPESSATDGPFYEDVSVWISLLALVLSYFGYRRASKLERLNRFESRFGDDLRAHSRTLERQIKNLNAFIYPSDKSVEDQKAELLPIRIKIEDTSLIISGILRELDLSSDVKGESWQKDFDKFSQAALNVLDGIQNLANSQDVLFSGTVKKAHDQWQTAIDQMRRRIEKSTLKK